MRTLDVLGAVAAEFRSQVIDRNEQHIEPFRADSSQADQREHEKEERKC